MLRIRTYFSYSIVMLVYQVIIMVLLNPRATTIMSYPSSFFVITLIVLLPLIALIEEGMFRYVPYKLFSRLSGSRNFGIFMIIVFFVVGGIFHLSNLSELSDILEVGKYFFIQGSNSSIFGYVFMKEGIVGSYLVHVFYDIFLLAVLLMAVQGI